MHELSIAHNLVELVSEVAHKERAPRVCAINLRLGELSCVNQGSLRFCFEVVAADSPASGATLNFEEVPVQVYCQECDRVGALESIQSFRCPYCQAATADIRSGRELEIVSVELEENHATC